MINFKKGTGHSLQQSDKVGLAKPSEGVVAGMLVRLNTSGQIVKGVTDQAGAATDLLGFAVNDQDDGDSIASGKIGMIMLDGNSVIETDQVTGSITAGNFPVGAKVAPDDSNAGKVKAWASGDRIIGYVEGIRTLPIETSSITQNYVAVDGTTKSTTISVPKSTTVLGIKLAV